MAEKQPPAKKKKIEQCFRTAYTEEWPCLIKSRIGPHHAFCTVCASDFSIAHSGKFDCRKHVSGEKHKQKAESAKQCKIADMFRAKGIKEDTHANEVTKAEAAIALFIAKNNLPMAVADQLPALLRRVAPVAKDIHCGSSKTTAIIKEISSMTQAKLVDRLRNGPFTISTDGSNDMERTKLFPLVVRTVTDSGVHSELFSLPTCDGSATGEKIFKLINCAFEKYGIPWTNCLALGCDNASVMTGEQKGVISFCKERHPNIFLAGCTLHLVHIAAEKGADRLPISVSDMLVDIYYYFNKSSVRASRLAELQAFYGEEQRKMLKHVPTRWLSIDRCLTRLLKNWDALKTFFAEEVKRKDLSPYAKEKSEKILKHLRSRSTKLYCLFLEYTNKVFTDFLTVNQSDDPKAASILKQCHKLVRSLLIRFVKPGAFAGNKPVTEVQYSLSYNIKEDKDLLIGEQCLQYIKGKDKNGLTDSRISEFFVNVKLYFKTVCDYLLKKLPLSDPVLSKMDICDPELCATASHDSIRYFCNLHPILIPHCCSLDKLLEEFLEFQISRDSLAIETVVRADQFWSTVKKFHDDSSGAYPYVNIATFMLGLLTIPHSSAHCERMFSSVRKIKTDQRASLGSETLEALLVVKTKQGEDDYTKDDLKRLKACYSKSLHG